MDKVEAFRLSLNQYFVIGASVFVWNNLSITKALFRLTTSSLLATHITEQCHSHRNSMAFQLDFYANIEKFSNSLRGGFIDFREFIKQSRDFHFLDGFIAGCVRRGIFILQLECKFCVNICLLQYYRR
jgi:hypothetical protein